MEKTKLNYGKTILTGFGFLGTSIAWAIYDPYITKILNRFLSGSHTVAAWSEKLAGNRLLQGFIESQGSSAFAAGRFTLVPLFIGVIMTFDNIFGVIFQPAFGKLSDTCHSRLGKRRPFILFGAPLSALLFALIPHAQTLPWLMLCIILFVFVMSLWRSPVVALMPDLTPPALRSDGNAVINLMGGVGGGVGLVAGTIVTACYVLFTGVQKQDLPEEKTFPWVFFVGAAVMVLGMLVLLFFVKEPDSRLLSAAVLAQKDAAARKLAEKQAKAEAKAALKQQKLSRGERASLGFMLGCLFFMFCGTNAITTFFSLFAEEVLHKNTAQATLLTVVLFGCSALAALPSGKLGRRFGRKKTIIAGLVLFLTAFLVFFVVFLFAVHAQGMGTKQWIAHNHGWLAGMSSVSGPAVEHVERTLNMLVFPVLALAGLANMMITVNTLPLVLEIGGVQKVGTFTGYYYTATFAAQIASPIVYGFFRMFSGSYISLFYYSPIAFALSLLCVFFVRHGEAVPQDVLDAAEAAGG